MVVKAGSVKDVDGDLVVALDQVSFHVMMEVATIQREDVENKVIQDRQEQVRNSMLL